MCSSVGEVYEMGYLDSSVNIKDKESMDGFTEDKSKKGGKGWMSEKWKQQCL